MEQRTELEQELAAIEKDYKEYPSMTRAEWDEDKDLLPLTVAKFGNYAAYDAHCRQRAARRRVLVRTLY